MARFARLARWALWIAAVPVVVLGGAFLVLTRTDTGATFVVQRGAMLLEDRIQGTLRVESASSTDLLGGATLRGVELRGRDGRLFVRADSVRARYTASGFLARSFVFRDVRVWNPRVVVERLPGQAELNVDRIFPPGPPAPDTARPQARPGARGRIVFRDVRIEGGAVDVLLPIPDSVEVDPTAFTAEAPDGGRLRRYGVREIRAELPRVAVDEPGLDGEVAEVSSLSLVAEAIREPVRVTGLTGEIRRVESAVTVRAGSLRLADTEASGTLRVEWGGESLVLIGDLGEGDVALRDFQWLVPRLPDARGRFSRLLFEVDDAGSRWEMEEMDVRMDESRLRATGGVELREQVALRGLRIGADPVAVSRLDPWLAEPLPLEGRLRGDMTLDGPLDGVSLDGTVTLEEPGYRPTTTEVSGSLRLAGGFGARSFEAVVEPLDWRLARIVAPALKLQGAGRLELEIDGRLSEGVSIVAEALHREPGLSPSDVDVQGTVRAVDDRFELDLDADVDRLALAALRGMTSGFTPTGEVEGSVRIRGPLRALELDADLESSRGRVALETVFDATDLAAGYELDGEFTDFDLSGLVDELPAPTVVSGTLTARARGFTRETVNGRAELTLRNSSLGRLAVDSAGLSVRTEEDALRVDTLEAATNLGRISGGGRMGLRPGADEGELHLSLRNDSVVTAQSLIYGERVIARDTLTALERERLVTDGIDPDTLPTAASVALGGRYRADVSLRGGVGSFTAEGTASVEELVFGPNFLQGARASFTAEGLPALDGRLLVSVSADSLRWMERSYIGGEAEVDYRRPGGRVTATLRRSESEDYRARAAFEVDSPGGVVHLDELVMRFESVRWNLGGPASLSWSEDAVTVNDFQLVRPGEDGMRIRADGRLPFRGSADFELDVEQLDLARAGRLIQTDEDFGGILDLRVRVNGSAEDPRMEGRLDVTDLRFRNIRMSRASGDLDYRDRRIRGSLEAWRDSLLAARVEGAVPADLAFRPVEDRFPDDPVDLSVAVDSFPLAVLATMLDAVEDVQGTVAGELQVGGTTDALEPGGSLQVAGGAFSLPGLGIRPVEIGGDVTVSRDGTARVDLRGSSRGQATVRGTVDLNPVSNPGFDLTIEASGFQAADRRDLSARLGGLATLTGSFRQPVVEGAVRVSRGSLFLEEFERSAQVVDLSNPRFFDVVDTAAVGGPTVVDATRNPFLQNLRMNVDVTVSRDTWLRSRDMNVEIGGELTINYDRTNEVMVFLGQLGAIRGTYSAFGRQFQVREGAVEFVGTPGLNPNLNIEALTRLRTSQGEPLTITATVSGTLLEPRLSLSSDAQPPIAQSDLVSYLIFGRPSYALGSGESAVVQGAAGQLLGAAREAGVTLGLGALANQLGSVVRQSGLADYFAITEAPGVSGAGGGTFGGTVATTQVEAGWYLRQNLFAAIVLRPLAGQEVGGGTSRDPVAGARIEWHLGDVWTVEGFLEDRFQRNRLAGFGDIGLQTSQIFGFFIYRDWGY